MKVWAMAAVGLGLLGAAGSATAQYGGPEYGYRDRGGYDRDDGRRDRRYGGGEFDEREYLRCNPDVRRAVRNGQMESAYAHWRTFGRREGRRLSC